MWAAGSWGVLSEGKERINQAASAATIRGDRCNSLRSPHEFLSNCLNRRPVFCRKGVF